jgi:CheY-like chemotaxis protein
MEITWICEVLRMGDTRKSLQGVSVLVVDDNPDALDLLETMLTYYGALTVTADSGKEALARLASMRVDIIISDISMPGFSGHDFLRAVRRLPGQAAARHTPAIALTAFNEPGQREEALRAGFQAYWVKPFDPAALVHEISRLAGRPAIATGPDSFKLTHDRPDVQR